MIPVQAVEMTMVGHPHFTLVVESGDDHYIVDVDCGLFPETLMNKDTRKQFPKFGICALDPIRVCMSKARGGSGKAWVPY